MPTEPFPGDVQEYPTYKAALAAMVDQKMCMSLKYQEQQWRALQIGAHPELLRYMRLLVAKFRQLNIPMFPAEVVRTHERQKQLYAEGFSQAVGAKAPHPFGCAFDLVHSIHGWSLTKKQWEFVGHVGKELAIQRGIGIKWGGDFKPIVDKVGWDPAHWQLTAWRQEMANYPWPPE